MNILKKRVHFNRMDEVREYARRYQVEYYKKKKGVKKKK
jgi:hypothetical protein